MTASQLLVFITVWVTEEELRGEAIKTEDLVDAGYFSRRTAFRRQADFRRAFEREGLRDPHGLKALMVKEPKSSAEYLGTELRV